MISKARIYEVLSVFTDEYSDFELECAVSDIYNILRDREDYVYEEDILDLFNS